MSRDFFGDQPGFDEPSIAGAFRCRRFVIDIVEQDPFGAAGMSGQYFHRGLRGPDGFGEEFNTHLVSRPGHRWCRKLYFEGIAVYPFDLVF